MSKHYIGMPFEQSLLVTLCWIAALLCLSGVTQATDIAFKGGLLDRPCSVDPGTTNLNVVFKDITLQTFQVAPGASYKEIFAITLINCSTATLNKTVRLTFRGPEDPALPGALAVDGVNAGRLGVVLVDTDGHSQLKLGEAHNGGQGSVVEGSTLTLGFSAFVQATPDAFSSKTVEPGDFSATATFELNYQ